MTKRAFKDYTPRNNGKRTIDEAISEVQREMDVRRRLFDKWVLEGRMSFVDAHDRLERMMTALSFLIAYSADLESADAERNNPPANDAEDISAFGIDTGPAQAAA